MSGNPKLAETELKLLKSLLSVYKSRECTLNASYPDASEFIELKTELSRVKCDSSGNGTILYKGVELAVVGNLEFWNTLHSWFTSRHTTNLEGISIDHETKKWGFTYNVFGINSDSFGYSTMHDAIVARDALFRAVDETIKLYKDGT